MNPVHRAQAPALACCSTANRRPDIVRGSKEPFEARDASRLAAATEIAANAMTSQFGPGPVDGKIQARIISVEN